MSDVYVVIHLATTCDESTTYISKDSTEIIELAWCMLDATTLETINQDSVLVRPVNTPITTYCSKLHNITWENVRNAGSFKDAILKFQTQMDEYVILKNKDFSFVTMDISKLRVQLPREARDKSFVLPPYLQHSRVFCLQNEYSKWQSSHPEALSYTASSLSNIVTALGVDVEDESSLSSGSSPVSYSESTSTNRVGSEQNTNNEISQGQSSPGQQTKTKSTLTLYKNILIQIVKKSIPVESHPTVLTKPYNSVEDVKIFLAERSKILYLSNLPNDTTQSELESWFTQYGGRPIAFWTLKNQESGLDKNSNLSLNNNSNKQYRDVSGFAVFSTHEEATESLAMNGRVLNDRAIEVQPSSTQVLDKATELLTPFPPSKNRPRPGDWTCPSCGFSNFQRRTACFRCSFPATSAVTIQESMYSSNPVSNRRNNNSVNPEKITLNNAVVNAAAAVLNSNKPYNNYQENQYGNNSLINNSQSSHKVQNNSHNHNSHGNHNHNGNHNNHGNGNRSHYANNVPFRAGDWKCSNEMCQYHNFAKNLFCLKCGSSKPNNTNNPYQNNNLHSVNSTAAAIAAATASGQSLNLNSSFMNLHQPQPYSPSHQNQSRMNTSNNYNNKVQYMHYSNQGSMNNVAGNGNGTPQPQLHPQQLLLLQQQQQQQQQHQLQNPNHHHHHNQYQQYHQSNSNMSNNQKISQSVTNSPSLYATFGQPQKIGASYPGGNPHPSHSAPVLSSPDSNPSNSISNLSSPLTVLSNDINSLNLNNN